MDLLVFIFIVILFYILTPGVLLYLPPKASLSLAALTHGVVFSIILTLLYKSFKAWSLRIGGAHQLKW
jgi:hypothetical protein